MPRSNGTGYSQLDEKMPESNDNEDKAHPVARESNKSCGQKVISIFFNGIYALPSVMKFWIAYAALDEPTGLLVNLALGLFYTASAVSNFRTNPHSASVDINETISKLKVNQPLDLYELAHKISVATTYCEESKNKEERSNFRVALNEIRTQFNLSSKLRCKNFKRYATSGIIYLTEVGTTAACAKQITNHYSPEKNDLLTGGVVGGSSLFRLLTMCASLYSSRQVNFTSAQILATKNDYESALYVHKKINEALANIKHEFVDDYNQTLRFTSTPKEAPISQSIDCRTKFASAADFLLSYVTIIWACAVNIMEGKKDGPHTYTDPYTAGFITLGAIILQLVISILACCSIKANNESNKKLNEAFEEQRAAIGECVRTIDRCLYKLENLDVVSIGIPSHEEGMEHKENRNNPIPEQLNAAPPSSPGFLSSLCSFFCCKKKANQRHDHHNDYEPISERGSLNNIS